MWTACQETISKPKNREMGGHQKGQAGRGESLCCDGLVTHEARQAVLCCAVLCCDGLVTHEAGQAVLCCAETA